MEGGMRHRLSDTNDQPATGYQPQRRRGVKPGAIQRGGQERGSVSSVSRNRSDIRLSAGCLQWVWVCPSGKNNYRDAAKMALLCATMASVLADTDLEPV